MTFETDSKADPCGSKDRRQKDVVIDARVAPQSGERSAPAAEQPEEVQGNRHALRNVGCNTGSAPRLTDGTLALDLFLAMAISP